MVKHVKQKHVPPATHRASRIVAIGTGIALLAAAAIGVAVFAGRSDNEPQRLAVPPSGSDGAVLPIVDVYKSATCGCCSKWVDHLRDAGFSARTTDTEDLASLKATHGVPRQVHSCHTALVDGYVIEGHVPAADIGRLLSERPDVAGLAVGGMPVGSPGMEMPGATPQPYNVMAFDQEGRTTVFQTHR